MSVGCAPCPSTPLSDGAPEALLDTAQSAYARFIDQTGAAVCLTAIRALQPAELSRLAPVEGDAEADGAYFHASRSIALSSTLATDLRQADLVATHESCHAYESQVGLPSGPTAWREEIKRADFAYGSPEKSARELFVRLCEGGPDGLSLLAAWAETCHDEHLSPLIHDVAADVVPSFDPLRSSAFQAAWVSTTRAPPGTTLRPRDFVAYEGGVLLVLDDVVDGTPSYLQVPLAAQAGQVRPGQAPVWPSEAPAGWTEADSVALAAATSLRTMYRSLPGRGWSSVAVTSTAAGLEPLDVCGRGYLRIVVTDVVWVLAFAGDEVSTYALLNPPP